MRTLSKLYEMTLAHYKKLFKTSYGIWNSGICSTIKRIDITDKERKILTSDFYEQFNTVRKTKRINKNIARRYELNQFYWWEEKNSKSRIKFLENCIERTKNLK